ncbi:double-strand break repair helicase AddA [Oricola sp.]|uniref:double-strand break repair helicase AddA n=1 Tax=Oricola sp. TaxID=1979950 RepID=UPI003BAB45CD
MSETPPIAPRKALPDPETLQRQARAASPLKSVWVSANAGAGKTYVLATRVIRLLLDGTDPSRILCLTYTRTAAAEMKDRVFRRLGEWVAMPEGELRKVLTDLEEHEPDANKIAFARCLFARALETPGGLKIQTIHAFCDALLHRFPLEANIPGHFQQPDNETIAVLIGRARASLLAHVEDDADGELARAFQTVIGRVGESGLDEMLDEAIASRSRLVAVLRGMSEPGGREAEIRQAFGFGADDSAETIVEDAWPMAAFNRDYAEQVAQSARRHRKKTAEGVGAGVLAACAETDSHRRFDLLVATFLKADGTPKLHNMFPADVIADLPDYRDRYTQAAEQVAAASDRIALLTQIENTLAALTIVDHLFAGYEKLKRQRGYLDFDDLIERTANLLTRPDVGAWVRYKLDQGIDHVLVDEAQDTSPLQWDVIRALTDEFFDGKSARDLRRTLFAVGDEKQSIYSFQGADPASFGTAGAEIAGKAREVFGEDGFEKVPLTTSFRSTQDVLSAVDIVFGSEDMRSGLVHAGAPDPHTSLRHGQPGRVEVWEMARAQKADEKSDWTAPVDAPPGPSVVAAERIADTIADWLENGEILEGTGRPVQPGDILVLVRSRDSFVGTLSRALKDRHVPVAGADRLRMTDHIAILDLLALAKFVLQPADDLSLAAILRSPLFDLPEETLFAIAHDRGDRTLFEALEAAAGSDPALEAVRDRLRDWIERARLLPVYEFFSSVLSGDRMRDRMIGRLGPETADMLDEFARFALAHDRDGLPSLQNFIAVLETASPEIKREMDPSQAQVRIMTVHGAKGLEAPVVFLVDRGAKPHSARKERRFLDVGDGLVLWNAAGAPNSVAIQAARDVVARKAGEEYRRLLYVGMTRAADRLVIAGYAGLRGGGDDTWHAVVSRALEPHATTVDYPGFEALRYTATAPVAVVAEPPRPDAPKHAAVMPDWFTGNVPAEPPLPRPLAPSGATGIAIEPESDTALSAGVPSLLETGDADEMAPALAMRRGTATHRMLQFLPGVPADRRHERAAEYCRQLESRWSPEDVGKLVQQALDVLDDPELGVLFGPNSAAEAPVMGTLQLAGEQRAVSGVIDRIFASDDRVLIADFKTNAFVPNTADEIPDVYLRQMALYQALVAPLYPGRPVEAWLIYTAGPRTFRLSQGFLDRALASFNRS